MVLSRHVGSLLDTPHFKLGLVQVFLGLAIDPDNAY